MTPTKKSFLQRKWPLLVKMLIIGLTLWFIYRKVAFKEDLDDFILFYKQLATDPFNWIIFLLVDFMMGINWYLEAFKWKILVDKFEKIGFFRSLRATLTGVTVSFFTPNRIGEFAGRILHIGPHARVQAALATFIGSASQLLVTCIFGLLALACYLPAFIGLSSNYIFLFLPVAGLITALLLNMFFHFGFLTRILHHLKMLNRFDKYLDVFAQYSKKELIRIFLLSVLRYLVFTMQFVILLMLMGVDLGIPLLFGLVTIVYFALAFFPSIFFTELPVRGSVALYVIGQYTGQHLSILCASFTIWLINLVIPAMIGAVSVLYSRLQNNNNHE